MSIVGELLIRSLLMSAALLIAGGGEFAPAPDGRIMGPGRGVPGSSSSTATTSSPSKDESPASKTRKRAVVQSALYLVVGIALLGVLLIVVVVLWAIRLRQRLRLRKGLPRKGAFDPLWYLRKGTQEQKSLPQSPPDANPPPSESP